MVQVVTEIRLNYGCFPQKFQEQLILRLCLRSWTRLVFLKAKFDVFLWVNKNSSKDFDILAFH